MDGPCRSGLVFDGAALFAPAPRSGPADMPPDVAPGCAGSEVGRPMAPPAFTSAAGTAGPLPLSDVPSVAPGDRAKPTRSAMPVNAAVRAYCFNLFAGSMRASASPSVLPPTGCSNSPRKTEGPRKSTHQVSGEAPLRRIARRRARARDTKHCKTCSERCARCPARRAALRTWDT